MPIPEESSRTEGPAPRGWVVGISGGSASGKSTLAAALARRLAAYGPVVLNQDAYFHNWTALPPAEREARMTANHPDAVRWSELVEHVRLLRESETVQLPVPGTRAAARGDPPSTLGPAALVIVEGHLIFGEPALRSLLDLKLFLDVPPDERVLRRMFREAIERGGDLERAIAWYRRDVLPHYRLHTEPTRQFADLILPWTEPREAIIDLIAAGIRARLGELLEKDKTRRREEHEEPESH